MCSAFPWPVQLAQAAAQCLDLLLVSVLLPLGQFHRFQHFLHILQGLSQRLDDVVDLFNRLLNGRWRRGLGFAGRRNARCPFDGSTFGDGLNRFRPHRRGWRRWPGRGLGSASPTSPAPATGALAAAG